MAARPIVREITWPQIGRWLADAGRVLLDLFYPPRCPGCDRLGALFCQACQARIESLPVWGCHRCGGPVKAPGLCDTCRDIPSHLDAIFSAAVFAHPLRAAIHDLKYNNGRALAAPLGQYMAAAWRSRGLSADLVVPVPLHAGRQAERGYNQAALLARVLATEVGVSLDERLLIRQRATAHQVGLGRADRAQNVAGAFNCTGDTTGKHVMLVDDVATTGATLEACAVALREAGASTVTAFTLARARWAPDQRTVFETERLSIRTATAADVDLFHALWTDPRVMKNVGFPRGLHVARSEIEERLVRQSGSEFEQLLVVVLKATGQAIGECKLSTPDDEGLVEPDLKLLPMFWGHQYGTEAWRALVAYQFAHTACTAVQGTPNIENMASIKMQEAAGGVRIGEGVFEFPESMRGHTTPVHHYVYRLYRADWERVQQT